MDTSSKSIQKYGSNAPKGYTVQYGQNGAHFVKQAGNSKSSGCGLFAVVGIAVAISAVAFASSVQARSSYQIRWNACRTYHVFAHQDSGVNEIDGYMCNAAMIVTTDDTESDVPVVVVPDEPESPIITEPEVPTTPDEPTEPTEPTNPDEPDQDDNTGNPGNDKDKGKAGEKCDKGMCENSDGESGEHGNSSND